MLKNSNNARWALGLGAMAFAFGCGGEESPPQEEACPDETGIVCTWAGDGEAAFDGDGNALLASSFYWPIDITFANDSAFIVDWNNHRVRKVMDDGTLQTVVGTDFIGDGPEDLSDLTQPGAVGTTIDLNHPTQILPVPNSTTEYLVVSWHNHKLRIYDDSTGLAYVSCGGPPGFDGDGGPARTAKLNQPQTAIYDDDGTLFILDQRNQAIRMIDTQGVMHTVAGTPGESGFSGDGGSALEAKMSQPTGSNPPPGGGMTLDSQGRLYFSDVLNHRVRRVDFGTGTSTATIETVAGNGTAAFSGDGGQGTEASLNNPRKLSFGPDGRLYIADELNNRIRALDIETGIIETVVGNGEGTFAGEGLSPTEVSLFRPAGVTFHDGYMYILDTYNHRIRRMKL